MSVYFMKSKADQFANGVLSQVPITGDVIDPTLYIDALTARADELVCPWKDLALRSRLRSRLREVGVANSEAYSWHSFRRGAAYLASKNGVADCVIKKHLGQPCVPPLRRSRLNKSRKRSPRSPDQVNTENSKTILKIFSKNRLR